MNEVQKAAQMRLEALRGEIDGINVRMRELLERRLTVSADIADQKRLLNKPIHDPIREAEILARMAEGTEHPEAVRAMFELLFELSKSIQSK